MNREHLSAVLWLRWRLRVNQFRKAGTLNAVLFLAFAAGCAAAAVVLLVVGFLVGVFALGRAPAYAHLFVWDGIAVALLLGWMTGLLSDLQRSESLALDRFLHLPVSPAGAFLVNYLGSLGSLSLVVFVPGMIGLIVGTAVTRGPLVLLEFPLLAAGLFALTAVTYQFQGWLASLMADKRRRRTIVVLLTGGFILLAQAPSLINVFRPWEAATKPVTRWSERTVELGKAQTAGEITPAEFTRRLKEVNDEFEAERVGSTQRMLDNTVRGARLASTVLPPGWVALGAEGIADGRVLPALGGTLGLALIGTLSLWRAYRTTLRLYTGEFSAVERTATAAQTPLDPTRVRLVERRLPGVSEQASAVATAAFRALTRAPEAKMAFLAPVIVVAVFGGALASSGESPPAALRPLLAFGAGALVLLLAGQQLLANQFGYDRAGFRAYVLSPAPRRDILLGKNLAVAPLVLGLGLVAAAAIGAVFPMRPDHYPAALAQLVSAYLILCLLTNVLAILAPLPLAPGSLQPASVKAGPVLLQMLIMPLLPLLTLPLLAPYGLEVLLDQLGVVTGVPISLPLSLVALALVGLLYRHMIRWQGDWLTSREQKVLEVVTSRAE
ncbi:hypothetical protein J0H58_01430 [bacterium]|nr:hypothetical protein [bacterium]